MAKGKRYPSGKFHGARNMSVVLPRYKCHKEVFALKIARVEVKLPTIAQLDGILSGDVSSAPVGGVISPAEEGFPAFEVSQDYMRKHDPQPGGYWVQYDDGYQSYSPAKAFEEGYTRI